MAGKAATKLKKWEKLINEMIRSGKTERQWCRENNIHYNTMRRWALKLSQSEEVPSGVFIKVKEKKEAPLIEVNANIKIQMGKFAIEVPAGFQKMVLSEICEVLVAL